VLRLEQRCRAHFIRDEVGDVNAWGETVRGDEGQKERFSGARHASEGLGVTQPQPLQGTRILASS